MLVQVATDASYAESGNSSGVKASYDAVLNGSSGGDTAVVGGCGPDSKLLVISKSHEGGVALLKDGIFVQATYGIYEPNVPSADGLPSQSSLQSLLTRICQRVGV